MTELSARAVPVRETTPFGSLEISFDDRVLRPRSWTTAQSAWASQVMSTAPAGVVLELCAGAGQIGLLALLETGRQLVCVDVDPSACQFARYNAAAAGLVDRVEVREASIDEALADHERFAVVIADPPWVRSSEVCRYPEDPRLAIDGGPEGNELAAIDVSRRHLRSGGRLLLQLGDGAQLEQLAQIDALDGFDVVEVRRYERGVVARLDLV